MASKVFEVETMYEFAPGRVIHPGSFGVIEHESADGNGAVYEVRFGGRGGVRVAVPERYGRVFTPMVDGTGSPYRYDTGAAGDYVAATAHPRTIRGRLAATEATRLDVAPATRCEVCDGNLTARGNHEMDGSPACA